jgi:hypothetical protein
MLAAAHAEGESALKLFAERRRAILAMEAGTFIPLHFVHCVISRIDLPPFLFESRTEKTLDGRSLQQK